MTTSPFLALPAAVAADGLDAGVAAHYGNPMVEQRRLAAGTAIVDLSHRGVLAVTGPDRLSWLNSMTSQRLDRLAPGESSETLVLDGNGRVEYDMRVLDDGVTTWLLLEAAELPGVQAWLLKMRFMLRVEVTDESENYATIGAMAPDAEALAALALPVAAPNGVPLVWVDPWTAVTPGGWQYASAEGHPASDWHWQEVLVPRTALPALAERVAAGEPTAAGILAVEALRIAAWRPRLALEGDEKTIPHELDWLRSAVHLSKGCYRGQETVAKVHNLGHPPRRLVMLHLDGSDTILPVHGDEVLAEKVRPESEAEWKLIGQITSAAIHHELGPIALAVVKRNVPLDVQLEVHAHGEKVAAAQQAIVPTDAGAAANVPRLPRLGARGI
ncbi:YgfZ/GcvT domain-containing protein [Microterricola viridarii]|uniref:Aminomethyltransferase n=1 Tax=Microterricola viridarii TaxID=412690 RepID=A0A0X8E4C3_9MICO|nr:glycine cleavage T C-terminal barrel domain-containing protein [Microterricola viridarii]AMB59307.1 aminomethyltransferase [Microterricola viridarii]